MKYIILSILSISLLTNCTESQKESISQNSRLELLPEPDKALREEYEKQQELGKSKYAIIDPDTSVAGIRIRNAESTRNILGKQAVLQGDSTHEYYSKDKTQILGLTVHPGDVINQVSIFTIAYSQSSKKNIRQIDEAEFKTEKGIKLGISKKEIIEKLGACYLAQDSTNNRIELNYKIELPNDSRTSLLTSNNMPIYYATYKLKNDKLEFIEFGFEYP